jgi:hypothetical protein
MKSTSSFVAISRFKRFDQFLIEPFSFERFTSMIKKSKLYKPRLDEETYLERLSVITRKNLSTTERNYQQINVI